MTHLLEIECDGDPVIPLAIGDSRTLPPAVTAVNSVCDGVSRVVVRTSRVTYTALDLFRKWPVHVLH